jgi:hypothetical protein
MAWISFGTVRYWIGVHPKLGPLVLPKISLFEDFDPPKRTVKLFIVNQLRFAEFDSDVARRGLSASVSDNTAIDAARAYIEYLHGKQHGFVESDQPTISGALSETERQTHCFQCRTDLNSKLNFSCGACSWIICRSLRLMRLQLRTTWQIVVSFYFACNEDFENYRESN